MPSIWTVPSLPLPPRAVNIVIRGSAPEFTICRLMPGTAMRRLPTPREAGSAATTSELSTASRRVLRTSTTGVSPVTVMVSCRLLTRISALMVMVPVPVISTPSRTTDGESGSVNVTL